MYITNRLTLSAAIFLSVFLTISATAQNRATAQTDSVQTHRAQNIYFEVGAAGLFYSLNYDTRFSQARNGWGGRLGVGTWKSVGTRFITVPFQVNYLLGNKSNFLELGAGATLMALNGTYYGNPLFNTKPHAITTSVLPTTTIGYRHQPAKGGLNFGVSFNPMLLDGIFMPQFGFSAGYSFK